MVDEGRQKLVKTLDEIKQILLYLKVSTAMTTGQIKVCRVTDFADSWSEGGLLGANPQKFFDIVAANGDEACM